MHIQKLAIMAVIAAFTITSGTSLELYLGKENDSDGYDTWAYFDNTQCVRVNNVTEIKIPCDAGPFVLKDRTFVMAGCGGQLQVKEGETSTNCSYNHKVTYTLCDTGIREEYRSSSGNLRYREKTIYPYNYWGCKLA
jgi:hypothetical protein